MIQRCRVQLVSVCALGVLTVSVAAQDCGLINMTQNLDPTIVINAAGLACEDTLTGATLENRYARTYDLSACPTSGNDYVINCVNFAIEFNTVADYEVTVNLYLDNDGGTPTAPGTDLDLIGSGVMIIPVVLTTSPEMERHFSVDLSGAPIYVPANSQLVIELMFPDRVTGDVGMIRPGANNTGETATSYILAPACLVPTYVTVNSLGFPDAMHILDIGGDPVEALPACPDDCVGGDGIVGVDEFLAVLAQWGQPGQTCNIAGVADDVGVEDFLAVLAAWGPCPGRPPFCSGDTLNDGDVGIADFLLILSDWSTASCSQADVTFDGVVGIDDFLLVLSAWGPCP